MGGTEWAGGAGWVLPILGRRWHRQRPAPAGAPYIWLVLALVFGFFASPNLAGLMFFERSEKIESQTAYAAEVEKYRSPEDESAPPADTSWDAMLPLETGSAVLVRDDSAVLLMPGVSAAPAANISPNPLFIVTGAAHTSFLRSATGDVYQNGEWTQLDPVRLHGEAGSDIAAGILAMIEEGLVYEGITEDGQNVALPLHRARADLLSWPASVPDSLHIDQISVSLAGQFDTLEPGVLPISAPLLDIEEAGTWRPFSATFRVGQPVTGYAWRALAAEFSESDLTGAGPVDDPTYYQLPEGLPERIRMLAGETTHGLASP